MKTCLLFLFTLAFASAQIFTGYGRNKIQYNDFEWHILKTKHFDVYYYPEMKDLAEKGAYVAEQSYTDLSQKFNHVIKRRIPLIFYSTHVHFQQTNIVPGFLPENVGGFFEFLKGRVVIPGNGNVNQFLKVIRHEMVHVYMHDKLRWTHKSHGRQTTQSPPLWYTEGLAEFYSTTWDQDGEMVMRDAVLHNYLPTFAQLGAIRGTFLMYKAGQSILEFIAENYGEEKILQILTNMWKTQKFSASLELTLGISVEELGKKWHYAQKKKYFPMLENNDFVDLVTEVVDKKGYNFKPVFNAKNNEVIFWSSRATYTGIYKKPISALKKDAFTKLEEPDETDVELLLTGERSGDFEAFSIFSNRLDVNAENTLVFSSKTNGVYQLYFLNPEKDDEPTRIDLPPHLVAAFSPSWSPDGGKIVFSGLETSGYKDIYILDLSTNEFTAITDDFYEDNDPVWSPNGETIVFSSDRTQTGGDWNYNLFTYSVASEKIDYLTFGARKDKSPRFSPDGSHVAFVSNANNEGNVYVVELGAADKTPKKVTSYISSINDFDWVSRDELVLSAYNRGGYTLHLEKLAIAADTLTPTLPAALPAYTQNAWKIPKLDDATVIEQVEYSSDYAFDFAVSQISQNPVFGTGGGAVLGFSDIFGDERYNVMIFNTSQSANNFWKSFSFKLNKWHLGSRLNYGYGIYRFNGRRYNLKEFYDEDQIGGEFVLSYPLDQYQRLDFYTSLYSSERYFHFLDQRKSTVTSSYVTYIKDNSLGGPTGPMEGDRFKLSVGHTTDYENGNIDYYTLILDMRKYFRITRRTSYAARLMTLATKGKESRYYALGGSWDLRGYEFLQLRGDHLFLLSQEYRFPAFDFFGFKISSGPAIGSNYINGAVFVDAGNAFQGAFDMDNLRGSFGVGLRMNLFGGLVIRYDMGRRTNFKSVEDNTFSQFFFGWDF